MMVTQPVIHPSPVAPPSQEREVVPVRTAWQRWLPAILLIALLIAIYWSVATKLVYDWYTQPDFSHGFLVPLFSAYLVWTKRETLRNTPVHPSWAGVPLISWRHCYALSRGLRSGAVSCASLVADVAGRSHLDAGRAPDAEGTPVSVAGAAAGNSVAEGHLQPDHLPAADLRFETGQRGASTVWRSGDA